MDKDSTTPKKKAAKRETATAPAAEARETAEAPEAEVAPEVEIAPAATEVVTATPKPLPSGVDPNLRSTADGRILTSADEQD